MATFDNFPIAALTDAVEQWSVTNCTFEGTKGLGPLVATTLSSPLSTGAPITSLPVAALSGPLSSGAVIITTFLNHTQSWTLTANALSGATSVTVASQTPNYAYPSGAQAYASGSALYRAYYAETNGGEVLWSGNWMGDAVYMGPWIDCSGFSVQHTLIGNTIQGGNKIADFSGGGSCSVLANSLSCNGAYHIDLGVNDSTAAHDGTVIVGNRFVGSAVPVNGLDHHYRIAVFGNGASYGTNAPGGTGYHRLDLARPINTIDIGGVPSVVAESAAGSSATASINGYDTAGRITFTTGSSGLAAGEVVRVTLQNPLISHINGNNQPYITLGAEYAATAEADLWVNPNTLTTTNSQVWSIEAASALQPSTTYVASYKVSQ